jgi:hypothetical protein
MDPRSIKSASVKSGDGALVVWVTLTFVPYFLIRGLPNRLAAGVRPGRPEARDVGR